MMTTNHSDWRELSRHEHRASTIAEEIVDALGVSAPPVDPFHIASAEAPRLALCAGDFRNRFDGQLEYHPARDRFLLFYNTRLDAVGSIHPRTRFSVAHELGHYYIPEHRALLIRRKKPHQSHSEFSNGSIVERQADAFAASLLMPTALMRKASRKPLTGPIIQGLAKQFAVSVISMAIRAVRTSDFPCAVVGYRDGRPAWQFHSEALAEGKCYPMPRASIGSTKAAQRWQKFADNAGGAATSDSKATDWFKACGRAASKDLWVTEHYLEMRTMETLVVLLTMEEGDLFDPEEDE